jgi:type IV pilus assembly protein PilO
MWQYVVSPPLKECEYLRSNLAKNEREILSEQRVASGLESVQALVSDLEARLREALSQLTDKSQVDDLLQNISTSAQEAGLDLKLFQRKDEVLGSFHAEIPVAVSVSGSFHDVAIFFDTVNRLPGLVTVDRMSFSSPREVDDHVVLQVDCAMTAHRLLTRDERDRIGDSRKE